MKLFKSMFIVIIISKSLMAIGKEIPCRLTSYDADVFFERQANSPIKLPSLFNNGGLIKWKKEADELGIPHVTFNSHLNDFLRTLFFIEGNDADRWVLIEHQVMAPAMISMEKRTDQATPKIWFTEYKSSRSGHWLPKSKGVNCLKCHPNGLREIVPDLEKVSKAEGEKIKSALNKMNDKIRSYDYSDWHGSYEPERRFPPITGADLPKPMQCIRCHDGNQRGFLSPAQLFPILNVEAVNEVSLKQLYAWAEKKQGGGDGEISWKVLHERTMPPEVEAKKLSSTQRNKILRSLIQTYRKDLALWLKVHPPCE